MGDLLGSQQCCLHYFVGPHLHSSRNADELTGFQISWTGLRSTFFQLTEDHKRPYTASLKGKLWKEVGVPERTRIPSLCMPWPNINLIYILVDLELQRRPLDAE